jgi:phage-related protein
MEPMFDVVFSDEAFEFLQRLDKKHMEKILFNIRRAQCEKDIALFKKVHDEIWEFRTLYAGIQYRLLSFWDNTRYTKTLVFATHGFIKKTDKLPLKEIEKAYRIREKYFVSKK